MFFKKYSYFILTFLILSFFSVFSMEIQEQENLNEFLHESAYRGDLQRVQKALEAGAEIDSITNDGRTALIIATTCKYKDIVKCLLDNGADVNLPSAIEVYPPLFWAILKDSLDIIKLLVNYGADVNFKTQEGFCALYLSVSRFINWYHISYPHQTPQYRIVKYLVAAGADVEPAIKKLLDSDIKNLIKEGQNKLASELKGLVENVVAEGKDISQAIFQAAKTGDVAKILQFAHEGYLLNLQDDKGNTPLHYAIQNSDRAMIYILLTKPNGEKMLRVKNYQGLTPINLLVVDKHELLQWIISKFFSV